MMPVTPSAIATRWASFFYFISGTGIRLINYRTETLPWICYGGPWKEDFIPWKEDFRNWYPSESPMLIILYTRFSCWQITIVYFIL